MSEEHEQGNLEMALMFGNETLIDVELERERVRKNRNTPVIATYNVFIFPKFNGLFWKMLIPDLENAEVRVNGDQVNDMDVLTEMVQSKVDELKSQGKVIPEPNFKTMDSYESSYDAEPRYESIRVNV